MGPPIVPPARGLWLSLTVRSRLTGAQVRREQSVAAATLSAQAPAIGAEQEEVAMAEQIGQVLISSP